MFISPNRFLKVNQVILQLVMDIHKNALQLFQGYCSVPSYYSKAGTGE